MASDPKPIFYEDENYIIRPAKSTDEYREIWWNFMQVLGWNRGYLDLETYMNPSHGHGMILLIEKRSQKPVGHVAAVINDNSTGWASMFIVDKAHRGKGMGRELFKAVEADFKRKGVQYQGLDGVTEQRQTYERRNFVSSPLGAIRIMIRRLPAKDAVPDVPPGIEIVDIKDVPHQLLTQHEMKLTGFERPRLWSSKHLFDRPDVSGVAVMGSSGLHAWALTRRCAEGARIGPVYADDAQAAKAVLIAAMKLATPASIKALPLPGLEMNDWPEDRIASEATLVTEVWGGNNEAIGIFEDLGWKSAGVEYHRMWVDGKAPKEQSEGGASQKGVFAIFDAATG